jgi:hypothetical protein
MTKKLQRYNCDNCGNTCVDDVMPNNSECGGCDNPKWNLSSKQDVYASENNYNNPTFIEKTEREGEPPMDRQNTKWPDEIVDNCNHKWQPVQMRMETNGIQPDLAKGKVYCVCMECCGWTYIETGYVGYFINSPDLLENPEH